MRLLTLLLLCLSLLLGGPLHAGHGSVDASVAGSSQAMSAAHAAHLQAALSQSSEAAMQPCSQHADFHGHAADHADAPGNVHSSHSPCPSSHGTGTQHHASGHVCCLPPLLAELPLLLPADPAPATLHARVRDLRLSERIDVPYRPPAA